MIVQLRSELRTARKPHRCNFCETRIEVGEKYHDEAYVGDVVYSFKSHSLCYDIGSDQELQESCADYGVTSDEFLCFVQDATELTNDELRTMTVAQVIQLAAKKMGILEATNDTTLP